MTIDMGEAWLIIPIAMLWLALYLGDDRSEL